MTPRGSPVRAARYIVVTGGVISGLGKGVLTASLGALFVSQYRVVCIKCDGYLNADPGTMNPIEHGEVYVLDDGAEVDMDFGHYERIIGVRAKRDWNITMGKVYQQLLENERRGRYLGKTVQLIPHATNEIKERIYTIARKEAADIVFIEIGGTIGDLENELFIEAIRQIRSEVPADNILFAHLTYVPIVEGSRELKSKPTQTSVKILNRSGIYPDIIFCRSDRAITQEIRDKISLYCNVKTEAVISNINMADINLLPEHFQAQGVTKLIEDKFKLSVPGISADRQKRLQTLKKLLALKHRTATATAAAGVMVRLAICGKYTRLEDSYASVREAILHAAVHVTEKLGIVVCPQVVFCDVAKLAAVQTASVGNELQVDEAMMAPFAGLIIPGGFGVRGLEEKITIIRYAREHNLPFMGICLGMQLAVIEYARHVCQLAGAGTEEVQREQLKNSVQAQQQAAAAAAAAFIPVIHLLDEQKYIQLVGGTMRLGARPVHLRPGTQMYDLYGQQAIIHERFRHRYEVNAAYVESLEAAGLVFSGTAPPEDGIMQVLELPQHPCFIGGQFHPELSSTLDVPAPFFVHFLTAAVRVAQQRQQAAADAKLSSVK